MAVVIDVWQYVGPALVLALILFVACKAIIGSYFKAKESFVERLMDKLKGAGNGKK